MATERVLPYFILNPFIGCSRPHSDAGRISWSVWSGLMDEVLQIPGDKINLFGCPFSSHCLTLTTYCYLSRFFFSLQPLRLYCFSPDKLVAFIKPLSDLVFEGAARCGWARNGLPTTIHWSFLRPAIIENRK